MGFLINEAPLSMTFYECGKLIRSRIIKTEARFLGEPSDKPGDLPNISLFGLFT